MPSSTPHYVATRRGDRYEIQPQNRSALDPSTLWLAAAGTILAVKALRWRGWIGLGLAGLSVSLFRRALGTGASRAPGRPGDATYTEKDVDEASRESFPASDAPSHTASSGIA